MLSDAKPKCVCKYTCKDKILKVEKKRITQLYLKDKSHDSQRWRETLCCFKSRPCACVGQTEDAAVLNQLAQKFSLIERGLFCSGQLIISHYRYYLSCYTTVHNSTKIMHFRFIFYEWYFLWRYSMQNKHWEKNSHDLQFGFWQIQVLLCIF